MAKRHARRGGGRRQPRSLLFELPFTVPAPEMVDPGLGIRRFTRQGRDHSYTTDVTLLDTPDHRLIRSGVLLAHQVSDGLGEWYLAAPTWAPLLPEEHAVPVDAEGDLPEELAELTRPFRRHAPLGPVAAMTLARDSYLVRGRPGSTPSEEDDERGRDEVLGSVRDDRITIRRGGVVISRSREVTIDAGPAMDGAQLGHLVTVLEAAGAARVEGFPPLPERIGAPATGLTDLPEPNRARRGETLEEFCCRLFAGDLRRIVATDLRWRTGRIDSSAPLLDDLRAAYQHLRALAGVLDPAWREAVEDHLTVLLAGDADELDLHRHEDNYLWLLDGLVGAARAPRLGDQSGEPAKAVLKRLATVHLSIVSTRCDALTDRSADADWQAALAAARQFALVAEVGALAGSRKAQRVARRAGKLAASLEPLAAGAPPITAEQVLGMTAPQAFAAGREVERELQTIALRRADFLGTWPRRRDRIGAGGGRS